jgi:hypothetical protein
LITVGTRGITLARPVFRAVLVLTKAALPLGGGPRDGDFSCWRKSALRIISRKLLSTASCLYANSKLGLITYLLCPQPPEQHSSSIKRKRS